jgi:hypothetical protein
MVTSESVGGRSWELLLLLLQRKGKKPGLEYFGSLFVHRVTSSPQASAPQHAPVFIAFFNVYPVASLKV